MIIGISGKMGSGKDTVANIIKDLDSKSDWQIKKFAGVVKDILCLLIGCTREEIEQRDFYDKELGKEWWVRRSEYLGKIVDVVPYTEYNDYNRVYYPPEDYKLVKLTPRKLLQLIGTDCGRNIIHPNLWVNATMKDYVESIDMSEAPHRTSGINVQSKGYPNWLITDVRFPNEAEAIKDKGGILIRINRLKVGDIVYWRDPENGLSSGIYEIIKINNEQAWILQREYMVEVQVLPSELSLFSTSSHFSETALDKYTDWDYVIENNGTLDDLIVKITELYKKLKK